MLESHHRRRLDLRSDAVELAQCIGVGRDIGQSPGVLGLDAGFDAVRLGGTVSPAIRGAIAVRLARTLGITRTLGNTRGVGVGLAILKATGLTPTERDPMEDDLVASGRFVRIEARGERSGLARAVTVGYVDDTEDPSGSLLVAAGSADAAWAGNLLTDPACRVTVGDRSFEAVAEPLGSAEHARAIRELILRYGTPAEGLGRGPSFRLRPVEEGRT